MKQSKKSKMAAFSKGFHQGRKVAKHAVRAVGAASVGLAVVGAASKAFGAARAPKSSSKHLSHYYSMMKKHKK